MRHALSFCFYACRYPKTGSHFWATCFRRHAVHACLPSTVSPIASFGSTARAGTLKIQAGGRAHDEKDVVVGVGRDAGHVEPEQLRRRRQVQGRPTERRKDRDGDGWGTSGNHRSLNDALFARAHRRQLRPVVSVRPRMPKRLRPRERQAPASRQTVRVPCQTRWRTGLGLWVAARPARQGRSLLQGSQPRHRA